MNDENNLATIATVSDPMQAHIMKSKLESEGISCFVADGNMVSINPLYSNALGGVRVQVSRSDVEASQRILKLNVQTEIAPTCPQCKSQKITYSKLPGLMNLVVFFLGFIFFPHVKRQWFCKSCHHTWRR